MKKLMLLLLSFILMLGGSAIAEKEATPSSFPTVKRSLYTTLYMQGDEDFTLGTFKIPLSGNAKVQEVSLVGAGEHIKLSWSAYSSRGNLVIEIQSEELLSPGQEKYTLSAHIGSAFISENFTVNVVDTIPFEAVDIAIDIPDAMHVGEAFELPALRTYSGKPLSSNTYLSFSCKDPRLTKTDENQYTATTPGIIPWNATLKNSNYSHKTSGEITVTVKPSFIASEILSINTGSLSTTMSMIPTDGYEVLGTIVVCADISEDDTLSASLNSADSPVQLYLCDPVINGSDYL